MIWMMKWSHPHLVDFFYFRCGMYTLQFEINNVLKWG